MSLQHYNFIGTSYKQGLAHGECLKESIKQNISVYINRFKKEAGIEKNELLDNAAIYLNTLKTYSTEYVNGINGISKSSNIDLIEIAMLNFRYELLYHALGRRYMEDSVDGCTSFSVLPESTKNNHLVMGQNWDWIPEVECVLTTSIDTDGLKRIAFTEAGIFGGKPGMNSEGVGIAVNGMYSTKDDFTRLKKPFHLRCYEVLRSKNMNDAIRVLTDTPRSCTANFIIGHKLTGCVNIELATDSLNLIYPENGIISHANHIVIPGINGINEPPNPRRYLSEFRYKRMQDLLNLHCPLEINKIKSILLDHKNKPQSLCRHRDNALPSSQHTITKTAAIMDLHDNKIWITDGQPCKNNFELFELN